MASDTTRIINTPADGKPRSRLWIHFAATALSIVIAACSMAACSADTGSGTGRPVDNSSARTSDQAGFQSFEKQLNNAGIAYKKQEMNEAAKALDAICGAEYGISGGNMTIFQFNAGNENYIKIYNRDEIIIPGEDGDVREPVVAYRGIVIYIRGISDAELVKSLMVYASNVWHR